MDCNLKLRKGFKRFIIKDLAAMDRDITVVCTSHSKFLLGCLVQIKSIFNCNYFLVLS